MATNSVRKSSPKKGLQDPNIAPASQAPSVQNDPEFVQSKPHQQVFYGNAQGVIRFIQNDNCFDIKGNFVCSEKNRP